MTASKSLTISATFEIDISAENMNYTDYSTYKIGMWVENIYFPILLCVGFIGNILTFIVMMKSSNRHLSYCWYLACLVFSDNCMLLSYLVFWIQSQFLEALTETFCRAEGFLFYWFSTNSIYLVVCLTAERYLVNRHRHEYLEWRLPSRAKIIVFLVLLTTCLLNIPHIITTNMVDPQSCGGFDNTGIFQTAYAIIHAALFSAIPIVVVLVLNIGIIRTIRREGFHREDRQLTLMLLIFSFAFIFLVLPQFIRYVIYSFIQMDSPEVHADYVLVHNVTNMLYMTNNGINFYLYCASVDVFRQDAKDIIMCKDCICAMSNQEDTELLT